MKEIIMTTETAEEKEIKTEPKVNPSGMGAICKLTVLLGILLMFFCLPGLLKKSDKTEVETEKIRLVDNYAELLSEEEVERLNEAAGKDFSSVDILKESYFFGFGMEKPDINIETYTGETINLAQIEGDLILEVIADWCSYCQSESKGKLNQLISKYPDVTFIQYMQTGGKEEVESFYDEVGTPPDRRLVIAYANDEFNNWLREADFASYPTFYLFNEEKIAGTVLGAVDNNYFIASCNIAYSKPLYEAKTADGENLSEAIRKQSKARQYISELKEIDVPREYLADE